MECCDENEAAMEIEWEIGFALGWTQQTYQTTHLTGSSPIKQIPDDYII